MRVALINSFYAPDEVGGAERSVRLLAEGFVRSGIECLVITGSDELRISETCEINGVKVIRLPRRGVPDDMKSSAFQKLFRKGAWHLRDTWNFKVVSDVSNILRDFSPDVLHTNNLSGFSVGVWRAANILGIPIVHTLRDYYLVCPNVARFRNGRSCRKKCSFCYLLSLPRTAATSLVDSVVGNSEFILNQHLQNGAFRNAQRVVIYNAYDSPLPCQPKSLPTGAGTEITLGYIGRLTPSKGVHELIKSFIELRTRLSMRLRLFIAGRGDSTYMDELRALAGDHPVKFLGVVESSTFYRQIDIVVVPSLWEEPLARVLYESFAYGIPVVASNRGGSPELVRDGVTGRIFDPACEGSLGRAVAGLLSAPQEYVRMSAHCLDESVRFRGANVVGYYIQELEKASRKSVFKTA